MQYKEIVSVTGLSGLYQLLSTKGDGAIVKNIGDKTTKFISARQHNVTPLESIEVYTIAENVRLHVVFQKMLENEATLPPVDQKTASKAVITQYFKTIFPEFDEERVYVSDMKKMLKWYELLKSNDLLKLGSEEEEGAEPQDATEDAEAEVVAAPVAVEGELSADNESQAASTAAETPVASVDGTDAA